MIQEWIEIGPIHVALPGAMKLKLGMCGDRIVEVETQFGFLSRTIEREMIGQAYPSAQLRFSRIDPECALILDRLFSEAVEKITRTPVSKRVTWIREITSSLNELSGFLKYLAEMASRLGIDILTHVILKHREALLDLIELLTGSRHGYYYIIPGGVRYNLTEGFQERLETWIKAFRADYARIGALFRWTHSFQNRLQSLGRVEDSGDFGLISATAVESPQSGLVSHVESRLLYAIEQTEALCAELCSLLIERPEGEHLQKIAQNVSKEEVSLGIETGRGHWSLSLSMDKDFKILKVVTTTPSDHIVPTIALALQNESFEDVPVILASLDFKIPEIDR